MIKSAAVFDLSLVRCIIMPHSDKITFQRFVLLLISVGQQIFIISEHRYLRTKTMLLKKDSIFRIAKTLSRGVCNSPLIFLICMIKTQSVYLVGSILRPV